MVLEERFSIVPEWVLDADVSDAAVRLYAVLLRFGSSSGQRMPSRRTLAERLRKKSVDSVDRALKELVAIGAVEVTRRVRDGVNLTNRYLVRSTRPGRPDRPDRAGRGRGGRTDEATPGQSESGRGALAADRVVRGSCRRGRGGRMVAATRGRTGAAGVAAGVRLDREFSTEISPPPGPSSGDERAPAEEVRAARRTQVLALIGVEDLADVAAECVRLRLERGRSGALWTADRLTDVLAAAVLDGGWPAAAAVPALLAVAADPATRSPARLSCPGPWWDTQASASTRSASACDALSLLEARLAETDGRRVALQCRARDELTAEGTPVTRASVLRRAVQILDMEILDRAAAGHGSPGRARQAVDDEPRLSPLRRSLVSGEATIARTEDLVDAARDLFGRPVVTAADLEAMSAEQRQVSFDAAVVTDLDALPAEFVDQARRDAQTALARRATDGGAGQDTGGGGAARAS